MVLAGAADQRSSATEVEGLARAAVPRPRLRRRDRRAGSAPTPRTGRPATRSVAVRHGPDARVHARHDLRRRRRDERLARPGADAARRQRPDSAEAGLGGAQHRHVRGRPRPKRTRFRRRSRSPGATATPTSSSPTLAYLGASLVHADRTEEGMVLLDEALAAVAGRDVDDFCVAGGDLLPAVLRVRARPRRRPRRPVDPDRRGDRGAPDAARGLGVLPHALRRRPHRSRALARGRRRPHRGRPRSGPSATAPCAVARSIRLADLRVRQGRFEEAEHCSTASTVDVEAARPAGGRSTWHGARPRWPATSSNGRSASSIPPSSAAAPLLALLVDVHLAPADSTRPRPRRSG